MEVGRGVVTDEPSLSERGQRKRSMRREVAVLWERPDDVDTAKAGCRDM